MNQLLKLPIGLTFSALNIQHNIIFISLFIFIGKEKSSFIYEQSFEMMTPTRSHGISGYLKFVIAKSEN